MQRILVVDDNEDTLYLLKNLLENNGFYTAAISRGVTALRMVEIFRPQLILLDINLVELDGRDICLEVKNGVRTKQIGIILISGIYRSKKDYEEYGCDDFIEKPIKPKELLHKINVVLKNR